MTLGELAEYAESQFTLAQTEISDWRPDGDFSEVWGAMCKRDDRQIQTVTLTNVFGELLDHKSMGGFPV